jgi:hypothetical protein
MCIIIIIFYFAILNSNIYNSIIKHTLLPGLVYVGKTCSKTLLHELKDKSGEGHSLYTCSSCSIAVHAQLFYIEIEYESEF